jgi:drug/metabolite transporter (DMT)-like permease
MPRWFVLATISMLIWAVWSLLSTLVSRDLSGAMIQIVSTAGLVPVAVALLFSGNLRKFTHLWKGLVLAFATGLMAGTGNILLYDALRNNGPASLVFPIISLGPLVPVVAAPFLFKERIRGVQVLGIAVALIAIVLLNSTPSSQPGSGFAIGSTWMMYTLASLVLFGLTFLTQKGATYFISEELSTVAFTCAFIILALFLSCTDPTLKWEIPARAGWLSLLIGILMGVGVLTMFGAYRNGKASIVSPYSQLYPVITVLAAVPLFHESIDLLKGIGIVAALAAGVVLSMEEITAAAQ